MADEHAVYEYAKTQRELLKFSSENIAPAAPVYVAWLDLMGAGHIMSVSVQKSANFLVRLHMAVERSAQEHKFTGTRLPINDGIYLVSESKIEIISMVQSVMVMMASLFIATKAPHDRCLVRGAIAFGPVYRGQDLVGGMSKKMQQSPAFLENVLFGPPIIQAYKAEGTAPPYGIAIHESARNFSPEEDPPFKMTHWLWWQRHDENAPGNGRGYGDVKAVLGSQLAGHFEWMEKTLIFHGVPMEKVKSWKTLCDQYFSAG